MRRGRSSRWSTPPNGRRARCRKPSPSRCNWDGFMAGNGDERLVRIPAGRATLDGDLNILEGARGIVLFAHGSGSSRHIPRNRHVVQLLNQAQLATSLVDLLTAAE